MSLTQPSKLADRYRLVAPLGQGGMGRVWRAHDEVLDRDVAIKELVAPLGLTDAERHEMRERTMREARAIAQLNHANVVHVFDVLRVGDGDPWIVMEYVAGRSLDDVIGSDGPLPIADVTQIGLQLLDALRASHRAGVVHRDVKPGNVLLADDGRVVLTDFGIATLPDQPNVTRSGVVLGSAAYVAPERARSGMAGPEADLWALGATLYAAVEGHAPFARPSTMETLTALATEPLPEPRRAGPLRPALMALLDKDPEARADGAQAEQLLRQAVSPTPDVVPPAGATAPVPRQPDASTPASTPHGVPSRASVPPPARAPQTEMRTEMLRPDEKKRGIAVIVVAAIALVLIAALVFLPDLLDRPVSQAPPTPSAQQQQQQPTSPPASPTAAASPSASAPAPTVPASPEPGFVLPAGWQWGEDGSGFQVPVPVGWEFGRDDDGRPLWRDPKSSRLLLIDQTREPKPDPTQDWLENEEARRDGYRDYRRIRLEPVPYWDKASDWEFTYTSRNGNPLHVLNRGFITAPDQAYSIYWSTPAREWNANLPHLQVIIDGFKPARQ